MIGRTKSLSTSIRDLLFPPGLCCVLCKTEDDVNPRNSLCGKCEQSLHITGWPERLDHCTVIPALEHKDNAASLVYGLKFGGRGIMAYTLSAFMADAAKPILGDNTVLVPVPLYLSRYLKRGFNQSERLAKELSARTGVPVVKALERFRMTPHQIGLGRSSRMVNVRSAFRVVRPKSIAGINVVIVDDVFTTGATLEECAMCLLDSNAANVYAVTATHSLGK